MAQRLKKHVAAAGGGASGADRWAAERWALQDARAQLSALIDAALAGRPQRITRRGRDEVVVIRAEDYERLSTPRGSLLDFLRSSPLAEAAAAGEIDLERDRTPIRDLEL